MADNNTDVITVKRLTAETIIGIHDWEQKQRQPVILNLSLYVNTRKAAASDDIKDALDYYVLIEHLSRWLYQAKFALIETLAEAVTTEIFSHFPMVKKIDLQLDKPEAVSRAIVGIRIQRFQPE